MTSSLDRFPFLALTCFFEPLEPFLKRIEDRLGMPSPEWVMERGPLDEKRPSFCVPQRGGAKPITVTLWSPRRRPDLTAFREHSTDGWVHFVRKMSQEDGSCSISIRSTTPAERWGLQEIEYHTPGAYRPARLLQWLEEEDGYRFGQAGEPFAFEAALAADAKKRIATRNDVLRFMKNFGIDLQDGDFWQSSSAAAYLREIREPS
jgi:hypothetical protein